MSLAIDDRQGIRWTGAAAVVLGLHLLGAMAMRGWHVPVAPAEVAPAAIMMDLEPATAPQPAESEPVVEEPPQPPPEVVPEVVLPLVVPKPKPAERRRGEHAPPQPAVASPAPAAVEAPLARPRPALPVPADTMARFQQLLSSHLEREKRYPRVSQQRHEQGTVMLRFTMDRGGQVLAASIERGSGFAALDREVLELIRRAQPLPPLPAEVAAGQLELIVAVQFALR
ncbi:MAG: tonB protein [Rhodospirillales bacterium]|nr:tonB protein [Rhodospirillales bacterium]